MGRLGPFVGSGSNAEPAIGPDAECYYLGHHRCASTWMRRFLRLVCGAIRFNYHIRGGGGDGGGDVILPDGRHAFYLYVNSTPAALEEMPENALGFHLIRDPRDVLISDYYSRRYSHSMGGAWKAQLRDYLETHSQEQGLLHMLDHCTYFRQIEGWPLGTRPNVLEVKYEDLLGDESREFRRILEHLQITMSDARLDEITGRCTFNAVSGGRERGQEDIKSHRRKGVAGDWKGYFARYERLKTAFYDRYGEMLKELGYAT